MDLSKISGRLLGLLLGAALLSCGHKYHSSFHSRPQALSAIKTVVVLPLDNLTANPDAGVAVTDLLVTQLFQLGRFRILSKIELEQLYAQQNLKIPKSIDRGTAAELARRVGADGVLYGSVTEFAYQGGSSDEDEKEPAVGINLRLVDARTGTVVWGSSSSRASDEVFAYEKDALGQVTVRALRTMLSDLPSSAP